MATLATHPVVDGQFILPSLPPSTSPALAALVAEYHAGFVAIPELGNPRWHGAAQLIHDYKLTSIADLAAKLIVAIHYRDPGGNPSVLAIEAPEAEADRLAVETELQCLDWLLERAEPAAAPQTTSQVQALAILYARASRLEEDLASSAIRSTRLGRASTRMPLEALASAVMYAPPASIGDIAVTLATAASWLGFVTDALEESSTHHAVGLGIGSALENATLLLSRIDNLPIGGEALDLFHKLLAEAVRSGAELAERVTSPVTESAVSASRDEGGGFDGVNCDPEDVATLNTVERASVFPATFSNRRRGEFETTATPLMAALVERNALIDHLDKDILTEEQAQKGVDLLNQTDNRILAAPADSKDDVFVKLLLVAQLAAEGHVVTEKDAAGIVGEAQTHAGVGRVPSDARSLGVRS